MSSKRVIGRNMLLNTAGLVVDAAVGFVVMPFLILKLGREMYGVWIVLGALTSYFGLLDLGMRGAIGRFVALHRSNGDYEALNRTTSAGIAVLLVPGVLVIVAAFVGNSLFFRFFEVPLDQQDDIRLTLLLVACGFAVSLVSYAFDAILWGSQRFDWINSVDIPAALIRAGLTFALIGTGGGLVVLSSITLGVAIAGGLAKAVLCFRSIPQLRIRFTQVTKSDISGLLGFGGWAVAFQVGRIARNHLGPLLIGAQLGVAMVTPYSIASRLLSLVASLLGAVLGVLTPHATSLFATEQTDRQQQLFLIGGRHACGFGAFLIAYLLALGDPLIDLWVGPLFDHAASLLGILALGELLPSTQYLTTHMLYARARHQAIAVFGVVELVAVAILTIAFIPWLGLFGVGLAAALPAFLARGVWPLYQGCRELDVPIRRYLAVAIVPPLLCSAAAAISLRLLAEAVPPTSWPMLIAYSVAYTILFAVGYSFLLGWAQIRWLFGKLTAPLRQRRVQPPEDS